MKSRIIGRKSEQQILQRIYQSGRSEFVAVCGRRRVGKTFLVKEYFESELVFQTSGLANCGMKEQIETFYKELIYHGLKSDAKPKNWTDIFFLLRTYLEMLGDGRKVVLLDELPWMDTPRSGFISALEYFWNVWASARHDIVLIVCGSSTSWMMDMLINNHGGLHNRLTRQLFLQPFNLAECQEYFTARHFNLSNYDIAEYYMILGGIPYYLDLLLPDLSLSQNIDALLFRSNGALRQEFDNLYKALFRNADEYVEIVKALSLKRYGLTRDEVVDATGIKTGGRLSQILKNLISCGFIRKYQLFNSGKSPREIFQLVDFFTLFYFCHINNNNTPNYWTSIQGKPEFFAWAGNTFEMLVLNHLEQVKQKLGISGVETAAYSWRVEDEHGKSQIDLVIDRVGSTTNVCEIKFSISEFEISKEYEQNLRNKITRFFDATDHKKSLVLTLITSYGVKQGKHSGIVQKQIVLDDLFLPIITA